MKNKAADISRQAENKLRPHLDALDKHRNNLSKLGTATVWITKNVGTVGFFLLILVFTAGWFGCNTIAPKRFRFDHSPGFMEWELASSIIQLLLLPLILIGQKLESREAHLKSEADLEINKQAEKENREILHRLDAQEKVLAEIMALLKNEEQGTK